MKLPGFVATLILAFLSGLVHAEEHGLIKTPAYFDDAEIDGDGLVWAESRAEYGKLYTFNGERWEEVAVSFGDGVHAMPAGLGKFDDGSVACIWRLGQELMAVSRHRGGESKVIYQGAGSVPGSGIRVEPFGDTSNRLWLTDNSPRVWWLDASGNSRQAYEVRDSELVFPKTPKGGYNPLMAAEDSRGRVWIWSNAEAGATSGYSLDGVLICDGDAVSRQLLPGLEGRQFGPITRFDSQHMLVSVVRDGLYLVDIDTFESRRIPDPEPKAFVSVERILSLDGDRYVITNGPSGSNLWRWQGNDWKSIDSFSRSRNVNRPWLIDGDSLLIGADREIWRLRPSKPADQIYWATGFPLEAVSHLFRFSEGRVFALGRGGAFLGKLQPERLPSRIHEEFLLKQFVLDGGGTVWCVTSRDAGCLRRWTGETWQRIALPNNVKGDEFGELIADTAGRIWLLPRWPEGRTLYFDTRAAAGAVHNTIRDAFVALKENPPEFLEPAPWMRSTLDNRPAYHNGQIAFRSMSGKLEYYDGGKWQSWRPREIDITAAGMSIPHFDETGHVCVTIRKSGWRWDGSAWQKVPADPGYRDLAYERKRPVLEVELPEGTNPDGGRAARDNRGGYWYTREHVLYRYDKDGEKRIFQPEELNPFSLGHTPAEVILDVSNHAFFRTSSATGGWFILCPKKSSKVQKPGVRAGSSP